MSSPLAATSQDDNLNALQDGVKKAIRAELKALGAGPAVTEDEHNLVMLVTRDGPGVRFSVSISPICFSEADIFTNDDNNAIYTLFPKIGESQYGTFRHLNDVPGTVAAATVSDLLGGINKVLSPENRIDPSLYVGKLYS